MPPESHTVGPFTFGPDHASLWRGNERVPLGHKAAALLSALAQARGTAVTKADLMEADWPGLAVEEGNLTVQIAGLRKALGPGPQGQDWIVTVPRVGYRLVLPQPLKPEVPEPLKPALAVLPFANLGGDAEQDYFADGVVEDIITALSRFKSLIVTARNVSFAYRDQAADLAQTARALGVLYLVQGSVRRMANRLRTTIHEGNLHHRGRSGKELVPTAWRGRGRDGPYPQEAVATAIPTFHFGPEEIVTDRLR